MLRIIFLSRRIGDLHAEFIRVVMEKIQQQIIQIWDSIIALTKDRNNPKLHDNHLLSYLNFIQYLAFRTLDVRSLQKELHQKGLSSLSSCESHIMGQLLALRQLLDNKFVQGDVSVCGYAEGQGLLANNIAQLFGNNTTPEVPYIMVTMDNSFLTKPGLTESLLTKGMNVARINCAHDDESVWKEMIDTVKSAKRTTGLPCKIYMDLAGPKIRTIIFHKHHHKGKLKIDLDKEVILSDKDIHWKKSDVAIGCSLPGIVDQLMVGQKVIFDDGLFEAIVAEKHLHFVKLKFTRISGKKPYIKIDKGINFPDSEIWVQALTEYDDRCLPFICANADMVGYSFVQHPADVAALQLKILNMVQNDNMPSIILKIETVLAVNNLSKLLIQAMEWPHFGVMIARGDLAVEIGFERMSEVQEEILWLCEAAHAPVIWATQVLENLNKTGLATRAEITDAAQSIQADCVMVNKGDYIEDVVVSLKNILTRSASHHSKKSYSLRPLQIAARFF
jgi:pyruvate kinase